MALAFCLVLILGLSVAVAPAWAEEPGKRSAEAVAAEQFQRQLNKGVEYLEQGNYDDAIASFKEAIRINPNHQMAHYKLGLAYAKKGSRRQTLNSSPLLALIVVRLYEEYGGKGRLM